MPIINQNLREFWVEPLTIGVFIAIGCNGTDFILNQFSHMNSKESYVEHQRSPKQENKPFLEKDFDMIKKASNDKVFKLTDESKIFFKNNANDKLFFNLPK